VISRTSALCALISSGLFIATTAVADHTAYDYQIESFSITSNGSTTIEEFDVDDPGGCSWSNILPVYGVVFGTTYQQGGICHLTSPGTHSIIPNIPGLLFDRTDIFADPTTDNIFLLDGLGDATLVGRIKDIPEPPAGFLLMSVEFLHMDGTRETFSVSLFNGDEVTTPVVATLLAADNLTGSYQEGLNASFTRSTYDTSFNVTVTDQELIQIDPGNVTGDICYRMLFNDSTNTFTGSISIDDCSTYTTFGTQLTATLGGAPGGRIAFLGDPITVIQQPVSTMSEPSAFVLALLIVSIGSLMIHQKETATR
jgi:hypothetical protein